jgi:hypothetical protein
MLDGISDIAHGAHACRKNGQALQLQSMLEELGAKCSPRRVQELLSKQLAPTSSAGRHRATCLLRKASIAAKVGNTARCQKLKDEALSAVDGDERELAAIVEKNSFNFVQI